MTNTSQASDFQLPEASRTASALASLLPQLKANSALFLDFDGTLADIASQPELVEIPVGMNGLLQNLFDQLGGALAIVTGRRLVDIDGFLNPLLLPVAAEHGAYQRFDDGRMVHFAEPDLQDISKVAMGLAALHAGLRVELKSTAVALHYRHAPELESLCLEALAEAVKRTPNVELMQGKCVLEVKLAGISKGSAIDIYMRHAPFAGRVPIFAGDDTTDEAGFAAVQAMGGDGIKIGEGISLASHRCVSPTMFLAWLKTSAASLAGP